MSVIKSVNSILQAYGIEDLGKLVNFQGGYINFGYWKGIALDERQITVEKRIESSAGLYELVIDKLIIQPSDHVLEVGCGRGLGCAMVAKEYNPCQILGVDITFEQIARAKIIHEALLKSNPSLSFMVSAAESISLPNNSFDKVYSVETAQHFISMQAFAIEMFRLIKPQGALVLAAHFSTNQNAYAQMLQQELFVKESIDKLTPLPEVTSCLESAGFKNIHVDAIGKDVFPGYEKWLTQIDCPTPWSHNLYKSFVNGYLEYYIITATR